MRYHWALDLAAIFVILAVVVPLLIMRRPARRPFVMPDLWDQAALWDTGVHLVPADPRRRGRVGRHRR